MTKLSIPLLLILVPFLFGCTQITLPVSEKERMAKFCDPVCTQNSIGIDDNTFDYDSDRPDF